MEEASEIMKMMQAITFLHLRRFGGCFFLQWALPSCWPCWPRDVLLNDEEDWRPRACLVKAFKLIGRCTRR